MLRAYGLGAGTYTGIEAVSNAVNTLREPRVQTGKRTMLYMAVSLSLVVGGLLLAYLLYQDVLRHDPSDTGWLGRDRFVLSSLSSALVAAMRESISMLKSSRLRTRSARKIRSFLFSICNGMSSA